MRSLITIILALLAGCAKTGDPLPPILQPPPTINDLQVRREGSAVVVRFRVPSGSEWIEIYRQCDPRSELDRIQLVVRLAPEELRESDRIDYFQYEDSGLPGVFRSCRYALKFIDNRGQQSAYSNFATLPPP